MTDPIALARALAEIPSPSGEEGAVVAHLAGVLAGLGYHVVRQPVSQGRDNLYAYREAPEVVFSTHLDVVPPHLPVREDEEFLWGRGVCDAKGIAAAMVAAAEQLAAGGERRIGLLFLVGEETASDGAAAAAALEPKGRFIVNGEPTDNRLVIAAKGALHVELHSTGLAAHSAYPREGRSAILPLIDTISRIRRMPVPFDPSLGETTINVGMIRGGVAPNVIPPEASATLLFRTVGPTDALKDLIVSLVDPHVVVEFRREIPAHIAPAVPGWDSTTVAFASDLPFLSAWGYGVMMGPGSILTAHTAEERISKAALMEGVDLYVRLATDLLAGAVEPAGATAEGGYSSPSP